MKYLEQKTGILQRLNQKNYLLYFLRELSALPILIYCFTYIIFHFFSLGPVPSIINYIGLLGAVFHSLTWLGAMARIMPNSSSQIGVSINYLLLITLFAGINYFFYLLLT